MGDQSLAPTSTDLANVVVVSLLGGMGVTPQVTLYIDPTRGNKMNITKENKNQMIQQTLHKSIFKHTRSVSLGTLPNEINTQNTINEKSATNSSNTNNEQDNTSWQNDQVPMKRKAEANGAETTKEYRDTKPPKPEPIFVTGVIDINKLKDLLATIVETGKYTITTLRSGHIVKDMPADIDTYKNIRAIFIEKDVSHYTYKLKSERAYRVVLRGLHSSEDTETIKKELHELGHEIRHITNIRHRNTKQPMPIFYLDIEPKHNNKDIFKINKLKHVKITFEAPYKKLDVLQCKRCQRFGHAKNQWNRPFRCVKCGEDHPTSSCLKRPDTEATCANCQEKHPASYKGYTKYKQYRDLIMKKSTNRNRTTEQRTKQQSDIRVNTTEQKNQNKENLQTKYNTYAQATKANSSAGAKTDIKDPNNFVEATEHIDSPFAFLLDPFKETTVTQEQISDS
ncbi:unnamed protein product [Diatraea saccharalis]|uniref:Pre-C2HC domain-containing protein n=1 Tax=Diatraea saccharalis TaxID=40085 RepID=A0A9N9RCS2_9NEOP|nr:unnamed protein product [Diatraea saccharalis]